MTSMKHTIIARAADRTDAHAFVSETTAAWIAFHLDQRDMTDTQIADRLVDTGFAHIGHHGGMYHVSIAGLSGSAHSLRGALRDWIDTRNAKEVS